MGGHTYEGEDVQNFINEADFLNDGRISYPEFVAYVRQTPMDGLEGSPMSKMLDRQIAQLPARRAPTITKKPSVNRSNSFHRIAQACDLHPCSGSGRGCCVS